MINVFIGYDQKEKVAYDVLSYSILKYSSQPVSITPLYLPNLKTIFNREQEALCSTEFSFSRFIVPHLLEYKGWGIFMDCDMLMLQDISNLWNLKDEKYAVQVCKHNYQPKNSSKFLGKKQTTYQKKNWSSLMIFNAARCTSLSKEYVHKASGLELHQFKWLQSEKMIGSLPLEWNWLAGEYHFEKNIHNIHYTEGGPWFKDSTGVDYSDLWMNHYHESKTIDITQ